MSTNQQSSRRARPAAVIAKRPGVTGPAAALIAFIIAGVGGMVDALTGPGLRTIFAVALIVGSVLAAFIVRSNEVMWVIFAPPLICLALALVNVATSSHSATGLAADYLTHGFPAIAAAVAAAAVIGGIRAAIDRNKNH